MPTLGPIVPSSLEPALPSVIIIVSASLVSTRIIEVREALRSSTKRAQPVRVIPSAHGHAAQGSLRSLGRRVPKQFEDVVQQVQCILRRWAMRIIAEIAENLLHRPTLKAVFFADFLSF
jgi:hypothetical protein